MGISKIGNLFAANVDSVGAAKQGQAAAQTETQTQSIKTASSEAAVLSPGFGQSSAQSSDAARQDRVSQLKSQVTSGQYNVSSKDVAVAVIRDIG